MGVFNFDILLAHRLEVEVISLQIDLLVSYFISNKYATLPDYG
ncbi:MAG: hypothetical protein ACWGOD_01540 [Desulfobulbales bacterium]